MLQFYKYDIEFKTYDTKTHKTQKDKNLVPKNDMLKMQT